MSKGCVEFIFSPTFNLVSDTPITAAMAEVPIPQTSPSVDLGVETKDYDDGAKLLMDCFERDRDDSVFGFAVDLATALGELPKQKMEARVGIEPTHKGFADLSLTTWVPRPQNYVKALRRTSLTQLAPKMRKPLIGQGAFQIFGAGDGI